MFVNDFTRQLKFVDWAKLVAVEPEKPKEPEAPQDPKDCQIVVGRDTTIEFPRDKDKPIGFSIIGGSETPLVNIIIYWNEVPYTRVEQGTYSTESETLPCQRNVTMLSRSFLRCRYAGVALSRSYLR